MGWIEDALQLDEMDEDGLIELLQNIRKSKLTRKKSDKAPAQKKVKDSDKAELGVMLESMSDEEIEKLLAKRGK